MSFDPNPVRDRGQASGRLEQARQLALPALVDAFALTLDHFDDALFDRAERIVGGQMAYLEAMRELRRRRGEVVGHFCQHLENAWTALAAGIPVPADALSSGPESGLDGLRLVTEDEMESRLAVRNLAAVIMRDCKAVLARLDRRMGALFGVPDLGPDHDPIGAWHVGMAVHDAFQGCDIGTEVRLVIIKLCERELVPGLGRAYEQIDQSLARAGVGVEAAPAPPPAATGRREPERQPSPVQAETPPPASMQAQVEAQASASAFSEGDGDGLPAWAMHLINRLPRGQAGVRDTVAEGGGRSGAGGGGRFGQEALLEAIGLLMQQARQQPYRPYSRTGSGRPLSQHEMLSVLSLLQATPSAGLRSAIAEANESLAQRLKNEVLASAARMGLDPAAAQLAPVDEDAIDLVGMLFDVILDKRDLAGRPRELIGRLAVPFVKVAMLDRQMFVQKTHPARQLLNVLAEACEGGSGDTPAERTLMNKVEDIVERLVSEFNENIAIFTTLGEEFREFFAQHKRRVEIAERRAAEAQRGQDRLEAARAQARAELDARVAGRELPDAVSGFLQQAWTHHLTLSLLRDGAEGESRRQALALADGLLAELDEARRQVGGKPWLQAWEPALQKVLASSGLGGEVAGNAIGALRDTLQAIAEARPELEKPLPELAQVPPPRVAGEEPVGMRLVGGTDTLDFDPVDAEHFRSLPIGVWLDFIDRDNKVQAGKLSWVSPISSRLLFVNRRGVRFCVASPEELAAMVRMGRLRRHVGMEGDAFDAAMGEVISRLEAEKHAAHA